MVTAMQRLINHIDSADLSTASVDVIATAEFIRMEAVRLRDSTELTQLQQKYDMGFYDGCHTKRSY
jgi:hypothetical protein